MASTMAPPREGQLTVAFQMVSFLKSNHDGVAVFDPTKPGIDETQFPTEDWSATPYCHCKEDAPSNAPVIRGMCFNVRAFVNYDHFGDSFALHSRTSFIEFLNSAHAFVCSKK